MGKLAANWPFLLVSQLVRGKFLIKPEIAFAMAPQVLDIIEGKSTKGDRRNIRVDVIGDLIAGSTYRKSFFFQDDEDDEIQESNGSIYDDAPEGSVAFIPIRGSMMKYGSWCDYGTTEIAGMIRDAASHKNIAAIVLDIDSGGGGVDAVAPLVDAVRFTKEQGKAIVSSVDLCCSAAYWVASETDYIVADNNISAEIGSIGVMMSFGDMREYYESKGIKLHEIYSSLSSHKNLGYKEARDGKYEKITLEELDPLAASFQETIRKNRSGKLDESIEGIIEGKTFFSETALKIGLIDRIGSRSTAAKVALSLTHANHLYKS